MKQVKVIPSKSDAHRAMICAALSEIQGGGSCRLICGETSADMEATKKCLAALKKAVEGRSGEPAVMECGESGSTLRFLLPVTGALGVTGEFMPEGRLPERPLSPLYEEMEAHGCSMSPQGAVPFTVSGKLKPGTYILPGNVSSQYITGLLLALPLLEGDSAVEVTGPLESAAYVEMTLKVMKDFGIHIEVERNEGLRYVVRGGRKYAGPEEYEVEGDWSNGVFWMAAGALTEEGVACLGLNMDSVQGDKAAVRILGAMGAETGAEDGVIWTRKKSLHGITVDAGPIPDMIPALALVASVADGETRIVNGGRLRIKESDRLSSITDVLTRLGADVRELPDGLVIRGVSRLKGGWVSGHNDHRIVMMAAIGSLICDRPVTITGARAVNKSYPSFFDRMEELGFMGNLILK